MELAFCVFGGFFYAIIEYMSKNIVFYSPVSLEPWDHATPWISGIGGSETSHIELSSILSRRGHNVISYNNCEHPNRERVIKPNDGVLWEPLDAHKYICNSTNYFIYRDPYFFDRDDLAGMGNQYLFIAQDVDYDWNETRLSRIDKYICLCETHAKYTLKKYPQLKNRVYISSNGIRSTYIKELYQFHPQFRNPKRLMYASSPDRGLLLILQNWFRIKERVPDAELYIYYGFNNVDEIVKRMAGNSPLISLKNEISNLMDQDDVFFEGRINQRDLFLEWMKTGVFLYPSDWPETSCISIMEAQACGAIPITNKFWAQGENCLNGILVDGVPQKDTFCKHSMLRHTCDLLNDPAYQEQLRKPCIEDALDTFDWEKIATQMENFLI